MVVTEISSTEMKSVAFRFLKNRRYISNDIQSLEKSEIDELTIKYAPIVENVIMFDDGTIPNKTTFTVSENERLVLREMPWIKSVFAFSIYEQFTVDKKPVLRRCKYGFRQGMSIPSLSSKRTVQIISPPRDNVFDETSKNMHQNRNLSSSSPHDLLTYEVFEVVDDKYVSDGLKKCSQYDFLQMLLNDEFNLND